jgi:penicillin-binding protein 2
MEKPFTFKNHQQEIKLVQRRTIFAALFILLCVGLLVMRLVYLQVEQNKLYLTLSDQNQFTVLPIPPPRGLIYDRNGVALAQNIPVYSLEIIPEKVANIDKTIAELQKIITITPENIEQFKRQLRYRRRFETVPLRVTLTEDEVALFYLDQYRFPGVLAEARLIRYYPLGADTVSALGYVARINPQELSEVDTNNYLGTSYIGKIGIEKFYENQLHGSIGYKEVEMNAMGNIVRVIKSTPPTPGEDIYLTLDLNLQQTAERALGEIDGSVVAIDPNNGEVLALVSRPGYDPNLFVQGMNQAEYKNLQNAPGHPLYNRAIRGLYPFASSIKPFLALEGLQSSFVTPDFKISDPGWFKLKNSSHIFRDWRKNGHGIVDVKKAIMISCDIYFFQLAVKMGIKNINIIMRNFGFGSKTGIDLHEELGGLIPTPEWKMGTQGQHWYPGDTVISGIGQGFLLTTPLQLAHGVSGIATRGQLFTPYLLKTRKPPNQPSIDTSPIALKPVIIDSKYWDLVIEAMEDVVMTPGGTAYDRYGKVPYTVAGKTGTAQLFSTGGKDKPKEEDLPEHLKDNTVFIAFAPVENPKIAVAVIAEHSHNAPQIARAVIDYYLLGVRNDTTQNNVPSGAEPTPPSSPQ